MNALCKIQFNVVDAEPREEERREKKKPKEQSDIPEAVTIYTSSRNSVGSIQSELMKRASAKRIIERYFYMLTDGCGNPSCDNENCVSSGKIQPLSPNQAAALAVNLLRHEAKLCELHASKVPRTRSPTPASLSATFHSSGFGISLPEIIDSATPRSKFFDVLNENVIREIVTTCQNESKYAQLKGTILEVFSRAETLSKSFLKPEPVPHFNRFGSGDLIGLDKEKLRELEGETEKDVDSSLDSKMSFNWDSDEIELDFVGLRKSYEILFQLPSHTFESCLLRALKLLAETCEVELKLEKLRDKLNNPEDMEKYVISFLIIFEMPSLSTHSSAEYIDQTLPALCKALSTLSYRSLARICRVWARHCRTSFKKNVEQLHQVITNQTMGTDRKCHLQDNSQIVRATKVMKVLYYANALAGKVESSLNTKDEDYENAETDSKYSKDNDNLFNIYRGSTFSEDSLAAELKFDLMDCVQPFLPFSEFYNELLSDYIEMDKDYTNYKSAIRMESHGACSSRTDSKHMSDKYFSFMSHPFILTPATKTLGLFYDNRIRMYSERRISFLNTITGQAPNPYLKLQVRRDHLIEDTLIRLEMISLDTPEDFKKQLMIEFEGEQGMDEGGISKEFFQLIIEEIFNPDYGMFTFDPDTQVCWFNTMSFENESQYMLIGLMLGLAIYNSIILDVHFPMVVYKKLLGKKGTLSDLEDFNPVLYNSLKCLLEHKEDDVEEVYMQTFCITYKDPFGSVIHHELIPDGDKVSVSLYNKQQFVNLYADFLLNQSVAKQFNAFRKGFRVVTDESPLKFLFRPEEIEVLVCGSKNFDLNELQQSTRYDGGYDGSTRVIKYFWEFVHALSHENQRKFLQFTTGSDRVPVGGLGQLHMIIARNGPDSDRLPTAHTCFNVLLLPEYSTKEKLFDRMMKAIHYSKGFGML